MGPFTALVRGEYLDYEAAPPRARMAKRVTLATRVRLPGPLTLQVNYLRQKGRSCRTSSLNHSTSARHTPSESIASDELHHQRNSLARSDGGARRRRHPSARGAVARGRRVTATRVATRSAVDRAADTLEGARTAFYRLVDERAEFATRQTRLITELPRFRSMMINPVVANDVATLTEMAESYRQSLDAQFAIVTAPDGRPLATPGWPQGQDMPASMLAVIRGAAAGESRREIVPIDGKLVLVTSEPAKFTEAEVLGTVTFGFPLDDRFAKELSQIARADINLVSGNRLAGSSLSTDEQKEMAAASRCRHPRRRRPVSPPM